MKKFITLLLVLTGMVSTASAATKTTVYYAVPKSVVGSYTVKLNVNFVGSGDDWHQYEMELTEKMYQGQYIYTYTYTDAWDGVGKLQFQLYDGSTFKSQQQPIGMWTSAATYNGKMYVHGTGYTWIDHTTGPDITIHFLNPASWSPVNAYAWDQKGRTNASYGEAPSISENSLNSNYYDFSYDEIYDHVIFSNNHGNGANQTTNVEVDFTASTDYWVTCDGTYEDGKRKATATTTAPTGWVGYTRTGLTIGNFGTICLPFAATVTGATVFKIVSKTVDGGDNLTGINLESVNALEAGKAYIFKATATSLSATYSGSFTEANAGYGMMGNIRADKINPAIGNYVVGTDNMIHKVTGDGVNVGQYKGYITLDGIDPGARGADFLEFDGGTTGIETVQANQAQNGEYYNLAGQRVAQPTKGLYIVNGKKVIIK